MMLEMISQRAEMQKSGMMLWMVVSLLQVIVPHVMHATDVIFTLPALGPMVLDGSNFNMHLKYLVPFWEMVSLLSSLMVMLLVMITVLPFMQLQMRMVL